METINLNSLQHASKDEIKARTDAKLQSLIKHAYNNVPYYKKKFDSLGIHWSDIKGAQDLGLLPVLTRQNIKNNPLNYFVASSIPKSRRRLTSTTGSTGIPLRFYSDTESDALRGMTWTFLDEWAGVRPGFNRVWLGAPRPRPHFEFRHPIRSWFEKQWFKQPEDLISVFMLKAETVPGILEKMQKKSPYFIYGISSSIRFIASQIEEKGIAINNPPHSIIGTSDTLLPAHLKSISSIFKCPVYSRYGSYEMGGGAAQTCPDVSEVMHIIPELVILEVVDDNNIPVSPGKTGRILLTELTNYAMPFIRYDTGDIGIASDGCSCGRSFPTIREILGRDYEQIKTFSGHRIYGWEFEAYLFYEKNYKKYITEYEIIQKGTGIILRMIPSKAYSRSIENRLKSDLNLMLGGEMEVDVDSVEHIENGPNGKKALIRII